MNLLRTTVLGLALFFMTGATLAEERDTPVALDPPLQEDVNTADDSARPDWANPNAEEPDLGVDDDPTPFDLGTNPPAPD